MSGQSGLLKRGSLSMKVTDFLLSEVLEILGVIEQDLGCWVSC